MFSGARNPTVLLEIMSDVTGSQKSKMAASNLEIRISRLVDMIAMKFQRLPRLAIDTILNHTDASPHTSSTIATVSVAKCAMCISEPYGTGYKKTKDNANKVKQRCLK